jgi:histidinol-phosphate aminotransferase
MTEWRHDVHGLAKAVDANTRFLFIGNPDNPVGSAISSDELEILLTSVPAGLPVVLDEAYYEFAVAWAGYPDSVALMKKYPNLIVLRTFSKAYGLAGIRLGYGIGDPEVWNVADRVRPPFNVNRLAQVAASAALDDAEHLQKTILGNADGRKYLCHEFDRLGLPYVPSLTNFVLVDMKRPAVPVYEALLQKGVIVRPMGIYKLPEHLRVSVGLPEENRNFVEALEEVMQIQ